MYPWYPPPAIVRCCALAERPVNREIARHEESEF
jgi:hypothetical protein